MLERRRAGADGGARAGADARAAPQPAARLPGVDEAIGAFWLHYGRQRAPPRGSVARLAELALSDEGRVAAEGTRALFERVVEPLCDGFTRQGVDTYRRAFAQVIAIARSRPRCASLDLALSARGVRTERQLLDAPNPEPPRPAERRRVRLVVVVSRLTLGADVAIVRPVLARMERLFPTARIALVGADGAGVVARSLSRVTHVPVPYGRGDFLADRLNAWPVLHEQVGALCRGLAPREYLFVDPDSRLTQLGLLRPAPAERYFHFPSRSYGEGGTDSLGVLVQRWLDETFGPAGADGLSIPARAAAWSRSLRALCAGSGPLVSVSFGAGANPRKRAGLKFEAELVAWLIRGGCRVLLARGAGAREVDETYRLCRRLANAGVTVHHLPRGASLEGLPPRTSKVVTWEAGVDAFFAAIACADVYVGYDSAGQHIAAALGVPTLSVFLESAGARHALRWTPLGVAPIRIVRAAPSTDPVTLLDRAKAAFEALAGEVARGRP